MTKKRVYELAKELGLENKELISRLEKIGIAVKSVTSTIEDGDLERIQAELLSPEPREVEEKRIKSTVIRRRAVRAPAEEVKPEAIEAEAKAVEPPVEAAPSPTPAPKEVPREPERKEPPVRTSIYRDAPIGEAAPRFVVPPPRVPLPKPEPPREGVAKPLPAKEPVAGPVAGEAVPKPPTPQETSQQEAKQAVPEAKIAAVKAEAATERKEEPAQKPIPEMAPKKPAEAEKKPLPVRPPQTREIRPPTADKGGRPQAVPETPQAPRREFARKPDLKITKEISLPPVEKPGPGRPEAERPKRKGGKAPVEVLMGEAVPPRKKALIKKLVERKDKRIEVERDEKPAWWREEKKAAPVRMKKTEITTPKAIKRRIKVAEAITVGELAKRMGIKAADVINKLIGLGLMVTINQAIDFDTATLIATDFGYQVESVQSEMDETPVKTEAAAENLRPRAPVVTIMGHVDHGKTSLLDAIRQTNVIDGEAGGITQAIGAYHVKIKGREIVFLDTPGHEAFTAMRARGAQVTDIVVLVVAADDGVMGQTVEAINHARVAGVPIIVAINKIDKPGADPGKIRQALTEYNLLSEEWGGETIFCEVSAKKKEGIEELLEMILLQADVMELKADPDRPARGVVIEAKLDKGRGPVATVLIQEGDPQGGRRLRLQDGIRPGQGHDRRPGPADHRGGALHAGGGDRVLPRAPGKRGIRRRRG